MKLATEILIIVSQTTFFTLLFTLLKKELIDRQEMMATKTDMKQNALQLIAIYFAITMFVGILMLPLEGYDYCRYVIFFTTIAVCIITISSIRSALRSGVSISSSPPVTKLSTSVKSTNSSHGFNF